MGQGAGFARAGTGDNQNRPVEAVTASFCLGLREDRMSIIEMSEEIINWFSYLRANEIISINI